SLVRRLAVFCAVAGAFLAAYAVAQNNSADAGAAAARADVVASAQSKRDSSTACPGASRNTNDAGHSAQNDDAAGCAVAAGLPANARMIANGIAVRALAADPAALSANAAEVLNVTLAGSPNRVFELAIPTMTSLPEAQSKKDSSTDLPGSTNRRPGSPILCPGASRNIKDAGHSARNDVTAGCAAQAGAASAPDSSAMRSLAVVAGAGQAGSLGDGGAAVSAQLDLSADSLVERSGIAVAPDGTIFIADTQNSTIRSVGAASSSEPGVIRSVAGRWAARQNIALGQPMGIAVDRAGNLYIADYSAGAVDVLSAATGQLSTLAQVISPASIAVKPDGGEVFVASPATGGVFAITASTGSIAAVSGFAPQSVSASAPGPCSSVGANVGANPDGASATA